MRDLFDNEKRIICSCIIDFFEHTFVRRRAGWCRQEAGGRVGLVVDWMLQQPVIFGKMEG
ncbi:hypothetical protein [Massilia sp. BHUDP2]|uniref:hypothetical protein n=1 Tax=Massilia sp. BHUDP2 TaxID=3034505 RepID=UPI003906BBAE